MLTREHCTEVVFHHVGEQGGHAEALFGFADGPSAPELIDDAGRAYAPVIDQPVSATGTGDQIGDARRLISDGAEPPQPVSAAPVPTASRVRRTPRAYRRVAGAGSTVARRHPEPAPAHAERG